MYPGDAVFPVYCKECWFGDGWDASVYGSKFDENTNFFVQFKSLIEKVPRLALFQRNLLDSPFTNMSAESRNIYLSYSAVAGCEDVYYSKNLDGSRISFDSLNCVGIEKCYENIDGEKNFNSRYLINSRNCIDSAFLFDCANCSNCILSAGLRNKQFVIRGVQHSKDNYLAELGKLINGSLVENEVIKKEFSELSKKAPRKYANILRAVNVTGDNISNAKHVKNSFDVYNAENVAYCFRALELKDTWDAINMGFNSELVYEYVTGGKNGSNVRFSVAALDSAKNFQYTDYCWSSDSLFGCAGMRKKQYCVLNEQYDKDVYELLVSKIIKSMNDKPYKDGQGREYRYGEFFPSELSPFAYNETISQEYFPLAKNEAINRGYRWKDEEIRNYQITRKTEEIPDNIKDVSDSIINDVIQCGHLDCNHQCTVAFKIISNELEFYRAMNLPLPRFCPNCRHYERLKQRNPLKLWHRQCMCDKTNHGHAGKCSNEFETSYSPDRPEIVYCEKCYQAEVV